MGAKSYLPTLFLGPSRSNSISSGHGTRQCCLFISGPHYNCTAYQHSGKLDTMFTLDM